MRKLFLIFLFSLNCMADPFYSEENGKREINSNKSIFNFTSCQAPKNLEQIYLPMDFFDLKLVGIVKNAETYTALFNYQSKEKSPPQLIDLKQDDFIVNEQIQIEKIDLKKVQIIDWMNSEICAEPKRIQLKL